VHLTALIENPDHVCCRYRLKAFRPYLEQAGHQIEFRSLPQRWWSRIGSFRGLSRTDSVILQRKLLQPWQLYLLGRTVPLLLYDFDDAVFLRDSYAPKGLHDPRRLRRFTATVRAAEVVVAGNSFLREQALARCGHDQVEVIPTCIDSAVYPLAEHRPAGPGVELVWIGSSSTLRGLETIRPLLEQVGRRCRGLRLKLICDRSISLEHLEVLPCEWTQAGEARELAGADIGISWLPDDLWSRGKCGLKVLQYMAAGLPVIANPVGVHRDLVVDSETGFLARTPEQWFDAVRRLVHDPALRRRLGQAGRRRVEKEFSVAAGAAHWLALLADLRRRRSVA
jgi:glycosyltransferase involved in cell wall biosynthesis